MPSLDAALAELRALHDRHWPHGVPREPHYPYGELDLGSYLRRRAAEQPDRTAIVFYGAEWTYAELDRASDGFASALLRRGIERGDAVAVFLPNCPQFAIVFYGLLKLGCVYVPINPLFTPYELVYELDDSGAIAIVALDALMPLVREAAPKQPLRTIFVTSFADVLPAEPTLPVPPSIAGPRIACPDADDLLEAIAACGDARDVRELPPPGLDDVAALNYTGGTTGLPKGCMHTQRHMLYTAATTCTIATPIGPDDVALDFYPLFWIAGEDMGLIFPFFSGATLVLLARWDPVAYAAAVERYRVTVSALLVDSAVEVLDRADAARYDLRSLRAVRVSSFVKKSNAGYRDRWRERTGTTLIEAAWGMTETHTCDTFVTGLQDGDADLETQPIFVGLPVPGTEFAIRDFETGDVLPLGAEGEIVVRTPSLMLGYHGKPEGAIVDGWFATGDIGSHDERGFLHFLGRRKEMLKYRGMSVFPAEIEALLGRHPDVTGSGVIGRADDAYGEVAVAFVVVAPGARGVTTAETLGAWCRERLAAYKVPEIRLVDALPLTATGKVKKDELARRLAGE